MSHGTALARGLRLLIFRGQDAERARYLPELARLRIAVFRDYPYLYDGSLEYEERYLQTYLSCPESVMGLVLDGEAVVGATTGLPLAFETAELQAPFLEAGLDVRDYFYCAESVLLPRYRGRGLYPHFFRLREEHARELGRFRSVTFCCVQRPDNHPRRPLGYRPLDRLWQRQGYTEQAGLQACYGWKDLDEAEETLKLMRFWTKVLSANHA